ncbi:MAG: TolC family protein, partial [Planctomycetota bacterium]
TDMEYTEMSPDFIDSVKDAFANRPDIYQAELDIDLQNARLQEAYSRYWPRLNANFWQLWARPDPHETTRIDWGGQWEAGITLNWALFDGLAREGRIIEQRAMLRQNEIQLVDTEEKAIQEVRNAILELQNARKLVESQKLNLKRADRALELVRSGYKEGVNTAVEVLDARTALTEARGLYYRALHRHIMARIDLQKARGILGSAPGTDNHPDEETDSTSILTTDNQTDDMKDETPE